METFMDRFQHGGNVSGVALQTHAIESLALFDGQLDLMSTS